MKKKILFLLGGVATLAPATVAMSCGQNTRGQNIYANTDVANIKDVVQAKQAEVEKAITENKIAKLDIVLVTASGRVDDKSFNQSLWEAISQHSKQVKNNDNNYINADATKLGETYTNLVNSNKNVWVLTGFQHGTEFEKWYKIEQNKKAFDDKNIIIIGVDWDLQDDNVKPGSLISLLYKTEEAGWMAGWASAKYLSETVEKDEDRKVNTFGGGAGVGVTDFIAGYLQGIKKYNENSSKITKISTNTISLNTGFISNENTKNTISSIIATNPKIILPVAGSLTAETGQLAYNSENKPYIIGVDTNQAGLFGEDVEKLFFTSIEKKIGNTLYRTLTDLFVQKGSNSDIIPNFVLGSKNEHAKLGFNVDAVGLSPSTIAKTTNNDTRDTSKAQPAIDAAIAKFKEITQNQSDIRKTLNIPELKNGDDKGNITKINNLVKEINEQVPQANSSTAKTSSPLKGTNSTY
ncbi:BMP family ABC transporter substrate-binding protein [Mycoplasmopsis cricetuli]|uniref:BMP family ABC transporter substrate-binding protein n=1 Tax=Mycoplasmopsis cricetuli TaxID=171283 RepID=UPI000471570D|nr:BMP family ABC transporter substrate-binding protein [Mycoplasmopsis cricetuli]